MSHPVNEQAEYEHAEYGRVQVVDVDVDADEVAFEHVEETVVVNGTPIPKGWTEPRDRFADRIEPVDLTIDPSTASLTGGEPQLGE